MLITPHYNKKGKWTCLNEPSSHEQGNKTICETKSDTMTLLMQSNITKVLFLMKKSSIKWKVHRKLSIHHIPRILPVNKNKI